MVMICFCWTCRRTGWGFRHRPLSYRCVLQLRSWIICKSKFCSHYYTNIWHFAHTITQYIRQFTELQFTIWCNLFELATYVWFLTYQVLEYILIVSNIEICADMLQHSVGKELNEYSRTRKRENTNHYHSNVTSYNLYYDLIAVKLLWWILSIIIFSPFFTSSSSSHQLLNLILTHFINSFQTQHGCGRIGKQEERLHEGWRTTQILIRVPHRHTLKTVL